MSYTPEECKIIIDDLKARQAHETFMRGPETTTPEPVTITEADLLSVATCPAASECAKSDNEIRQLKIKLANETEARKAEARLATKNKRKFDLECATTARLEKQVFDLKTDLVAANEALQGAEASGREWEDMAHGQAIRIAELEATPSPDASGNLWVAKSFHDRTVEAERASVAHWKGETEKFKLAFENRGDELFAVQGNLKLAEMRIAGLEAKPAPDCQSCPAYQDLGQRADHLAKDFNELTHEAEGLRTDSECWVKTKAILERVQTPGESGLDCLGRLLDSAIADYSKFEQTKARITTLEDEREAIAKALGDRRPEDCLDAVEDLKRWARKLEKTLHEKCESLRVGTENLEQIRTNLECGPKECTSDAAIRLRTSLEASELRHARRDVAEVLGAKVRRDLEDRLKIKHANEALAGLRWHSLTVNQLKREVKNLWELCFELEAEMSARDSCWAALSRNASFYENFCEELLRMADDDEDRIAEWMEQLSTISGTLRTVFEKFDQHKQTEAAYAIGMAQQKISELYHEMKAASEEGGGDADTN